MIRTPLPIDVTGAQALKEIFMRLHRAYPDLHVAVEDVIAEGDKVVSRNVNGQIVETLGVVDVLAQLKQLGASPI